MKIDKLINLLSSTRKECGNIEVVMDIFDTNTGKTWNMDDPNIIGIRSKLDRETIQFYDADTGKLGRKKRVIKLLPDFTA